jgi:Zn-dependent protease/CBS domain-containing protein
MRWSVTIGRFGGTAVKIHLTFLLFLAWIGFSAWQRGGAPAARDSLLFIILLFACVLLHEFGHILMARRFGIETPEVTLLPIGGVASLQRIPDKPAQELAVAIAGPLVNVAIAVLLLLFLPGLDARAVSQLDDPHVGWLARLAAANIFLVLFNMIPAFPMDGGRVLRAVLAMRLGAARATRIAATIGQVFAFGLGFLGLFGNPLLLFIAIFVYVAAAGEAHMTAFHDAARGLSVADAMETSFSSILTGSTVSDAVDILLATPQQEFPVVDAFGKPAGLLLRDDILSALKDHEREAAVTEIMRAPIATVRGTAPLQSVLDRLYGEEATAICVTEADGVLAGLLTRQNLAEVMVIKTMRPDWRFERRTAAARPSAGLRLR